MKKEEKKWKRNMRIERKEKDFKEEKLKGIRGKEQSEGKERK